MTTKAATPELPPGLADVAMVDAATAAAACCISVTTWHLLVRTRAAPQPVMRAHRCTRWLLADVRTFLIARAQQAATDPAAGQVLTERARKAAAAAAAKRDAATEARA